MEQKGSASWVFKALTTIAIVATSLMIVALLADIAGAKEKVTTLTCITPNGTRENLRQLV